MTLRPGARPPTGGVRTLPYMFRLTANAADGGPEKTRRVSRVLSTRDVRRRSLTVEEPGRKGGLPDVSVTRSDPGPMSDTDPSLPRDPPAILPAPSPHVPGRLGHGHSLPGPWTRRPVPSRATACGATALPVVSSHLSSDSDDKCELVGREPAGTRPLSGRQLAGLVDHPARQSRAIPETGT